MNVLVIGGMHGNEPLGQSVVKLFDDMPAQNVSTVLANEPAIEKICRFVGVDLNRSFPGDNAGTSYESRRAAELLELAARYDIALDFHNTNCPDNDCGFVGDTAGWQLYDAAWLLGLRRVVVADYDCINKYASNCLSVEISLSSRLNNPYIWHTLVSQLGLLGSFAVRQELETYRFVYRMTLEDKERLSLDKRGLRAFQPLSPRLARALNVISPAYPIFIDDAYTPYNYGGLLNKVR